MNENNTCICKSYLTFILFAFSFAGFLLQQRLQEISLSLSELELSGIKKLVRPQCDEVEEGKEIFGSTEVDEEDKVCDNSNINSFNSDSEGAAVTFHTENVNGSNFFGDVDLSEERYDSASSLSQSFDVPSIGLESREKSWSPSSTGEQSESEKLKGACAASGKRDKEVTHDFSFPDGAETQSYCLLCSQERQEHEFQAERAPQRQRDEREPQVAFRGQECQEALGRPIMCQEVRDCSEYNCMLLYQS